MNLRNKKPKNHREALVALTLVPQLGNQRIRLLLQSVEHTAEIFTLTPSELQQVDGIGPMLASAILDFDDWQGVRNIFARARQVNAQIITFEDKVYPPLLREIYDPPILLWVKGETHALATRGLAVVGTRRASQYGKDMAAKFSYDLAEQGFTITSGLAFGVDTEAHKAALKAGGTTIAVLGSGIDTIYPAKNAALARSIINNKGAVITEYRPGTPPDAGNFPVRNRIVSGLSLGTIVVESGLKGGSMITAHSALTQNREVFVVPHSLQNIHGIGCNHLIKRGAGKLIQNTQDIIEELPFYETVKAKGLNEEPRAFSWHTAELDDQEKNICQLLENESLHIDVISARLDIPSHQLLAKLLQLEMKQCIRQKAGKKFELR